MARPTTARRPRATRTVRLLALLGAGLAAAHAAPPPGQPAPALVMSTLDGTPFDLAAERGHVVLVNFWATWCPPCRDEMPLLDALQRRHAVEGVVVIGVSVDRSRDRRAVAEVMRPFHYRSGLVDGARNGFGAPPALPVTYLVDRDGVLRAVLRPGEGPLTEARVEAALAPVLAPAAAAAPPP